MTNMQRKKQLRQRILRYLLDRERAPGSKIPELHEIAHDLGVRIEDISDQLDILEDQGAIVANRTLGGNAAPQLKGIGKAMLEELEEVTSASEPRQEQSVSSPPRQEMFEWDAFISHATEDKESFVRGLAQKLIEHGARIWYDEFTLRVGDSLRQSIDKGLAKSRYGIVIFSPFFFAKDWPQRELNGLVARERYANKVILPVWLNVNRDDVARYSLSLVDLVAANAEGGVDKVVDELLGVLNLNISDRADKSAEQEETREMEENTESGKLRTPRLMSTKIYFVEGQAWVDIQGEMFATLVNWVDYEHVEEKTFTLSFPGGSFQLAGKIPLLTLLDSSNLPLQKLLQEFGKSYRTIEFEVDEKWDFGNLVRRSRGGVRQMESLSRHTITLRLGNRRASLTIRNKDEGSTITIKITEEYYGFSSQKPPIPYTLVLDYLEKDPPGEELDTHLNEIIR